MQRIGNIGNSKSPVHVLMSLVTNFRNGPNSDNMKQFYYSEHPNKYVSMIMNKQFIFLIFFALVSCSKDANYSVCE
jgi:hypothetical protein